MRTKEAVNVVICALGLALLLVGVILPGNDSLLFGSTERILDEQYRDDPYNNVLADEFRVITFKPGLGGVWGYVRDILPAFRGSTEFSNNEITEISKEICIINGIVENRWPSTYGGMYNSRSLQPNVTINVPMLLLSGFKQDVQDVSSYTEDEPVGMEATEGAGEQVSQSWPNLPKGISFVLAGVIALLVAKFLVNKFRDEPLYNPNKEQVWDMLNKLKRKSYPVVIKGQEGGEIQCKAFVGSDGILKVEFSNRGVVAHWDNRRKVGFGKRRDNKRLCLTDGPHESI